MQVIYNRRVFIRRAIDTIKLVLLRRFKAQLLLMLHLGEGFENQKLLKH